MRDADGKWPCGCRLDRAELAIALCSKHRETFRKFLNEEHAKPAYREPVEDLYREVEK